MRKLLLIFFTSCTMASMGQIPTDNLVAYYPFNGNANDESTNSNDGVVSGAVLIPDRFGSSGSAYQFDGTSDVITIPHSSDLDFDGLTESYTICCWVKSADPVPFVTSGRMIQKRVSSSVYPVSWQVFGPSALSTYVYDGTTVSGGTIGSTVWDGEWHFVVMVVNPDSVSTYLDGVFETADINTAVASTSNSFPITIGNGETGGQGYGGALDDLRFYSDALSDCEIWSLFHEGTEMYDLSVNQTSNVLTAAETGVSYQWIDCNTSLPISGETNQTFTAPSNGLYAVILDDGICTDTSDCYAVNDVGMEEEISPILLVYPVPAVDILTVFYSNHTENTYAEIIDKTGKVISTINISSLSTEINVGRYSSGTYIFRLIDGDQIHMKKLIVY